MSRQTRAGHTPAPHRDWLRGTIRPDEAGSTDDRRPEIGSPPASRRPPSRGYRPHLLRDRESLGHQRIAFATDRNRAPPPAQPSEPHPPPPMGVQETLVPGSREKRPR